MTAPKLPDGGGRYTRDDKDDLKQVAVPTKPAASPKPAKPAAKKKEG